MDGIELSPERAPVARKADEPQVLEVQWLEQGLLVHTWTVARSRAPVGTANSLASGALVSFVSAAFAWQGGWLWAAVGAGVLGGASAVGLGRIAVTLARARPHAPQRVLVELTLEKLGFTVMKTDRWSMRHDVERQLRDVQRVETVETPLGGGMRVHLAGEALTVPLYGVPVGDIDWLVARVEEARTAARQVDLHEH